MRNACHWWLFTLLLVLILIIPAAAQTGPQHDSRIFRTEPMGSGYARTGVNTAIFRGSSLVTSELDNNLKCVDLSDLDGDLPLDVVRSTEILRRTEPWENDSLGYPIRTGGTICTMPTTTWAPASAARLPSPSRDLT